LGNWGGGNWLVPWAGKVGESPQVNDAFLKGRTQTARSAGGAIGALLGGWIASLMGRRKAYFLFSITSLAATAHVFHSLTPLDASFLFWVFVVGFVGTIYFGWLPLYLPELFPTRVRATGSGVSFNFGRLATAAGVLGVGTLMQWYDGDYARVGQITSLTFALGMIVICFAPDTSKKQLED
jgi:MFS family permease